MNNKIQVTFLGGVISAGLAFILNVIAARGLTEDVFSEYVMLLNVSIVISALTEFGLPSSSLVISNKRSGTEVKSLVATVSAVMLVFASFAYLIWLVSGFNYLLCLILGLILSQYKNLNTLHQVSDNWLRYSFNNVLINAVKILSLLFLLLFYKSGSIVTASDVIMYQLVFSVIPLFLIFNHFKLGIKLSNLKFFFKSKSDILNIYISSILVVVLMRADVILIYFKGGEVKSYFLANSLCMLIPLLASSMSAVFIKENGRFEVKNKSQFFIAISILASYWLFAPYISNLLFGYTSDLLNEVTQVLSLTYSLAILFVKKESYLYNKENGKLIRLKLMQVMLMFLFAIVLVDIYGSVGMAYSVFLSRFFSWIYLFSIKTN